MNKDLKVMIVETYQKVEDLKWLSQDYITLFNKPENKDLGAERFFLRCEHAISTLKEIIELKFMARKEELQFLIEGAKAEKNEHSINLNQNELNLLTVNDFNVGFSDLAGHDCSEHSPIKSIKLKDIEVISNAIEEARAAIIGETSSPFSVLEWATIFYYADETKLLSESRLKKTRMEQFMSKHQVNTTPVNFKNSYYEAKRRINEKNDYPINKLELIIPFLKENYKQTVTKVENDIIFLEENKPEY